MIAHDRMSSSKSDRFPAAALAALLSGVLPIAAAHGAYLLNVYSSSELAAEFICMPYLDGCVSISRAARSGPGLTPFRWVMLASVPLLLLTWWSARRWLGSLRLGASVGQHVGKGRAKDRRASAMAALGMIGAVFLVLYVTALGNEGEWYGWQRRYGVTLYFGGTALAQLLLVWILWPLRQTVQASRLMRPITLLTLLVSLQWVLGVFSAFKRLIFEDPVLIDQIENVIEWWYAMAMSLAFLVIARMFSDTRA